MHPSLRCRSLLGVLPSLLLGAAISLGPIAVEATLEQEQPTASASQSAGPESMRPAPVASTAAVASPGKSASASPTTPPQKASDTDQTFWIAFLMILAAVVVSAGAVLASRAANATGNALIPSLGPPFFFWLSLIYAGILLLMAAIYNVHDPDGKVWMWGGIMPIAVPWFGALGAVTISLEGVFLWNAQWDTKYNYWHLARPLFGAVLGIIAYFIFVVLMAASGTLPKILDGSNSAPGKDYIIYYVVAFLVGYREETFRELIKRATDLILKPGAQPSATPSVSFEVGGASVSIVAPPTPAAGASSVTVVNVKNNGSVPLVAPVATLSTSVPPNTLELVAANDKVTGGGDLGPGQSRSVDIKFTPPAGAAVGTTCGAKLSVSGTNLLTPRSIQVQAKC